MAASGSPSCQPSRTWSRTTLRSRALICGRDVRLTCEDRITDGAEGAELLILDREKDADEDLDFEGFLEG